MAGKGRLEEETVVGVAGRVGRRRPGRQTSWLAAAGWPRPSLAARVDERVRTEEIGDRANRLSIEEVSNFAVAGLCKYPELQFSQFLGSAKLRLRVFVHGRWADPRSQLPGATPFGPAPLADSLNLGDGELPNRP